MNEGNADTRGLGATEPTRFCCCRSQETFWTFTPRETTAGGTVGSTGRRDTSPPHTWRSCRRHNKSTYRILVPILGRVKASKRLRKSEIFALRLIKGAAKDAEIINLSIFDFLLGPAGGSSAITSPRIRTGAFAGGGRTSGSSGNVTGHDLAGGQTTL